MISIRLYDDKYYFQLLTREKIKMPSNASNKILKQNVFYEKDLFSHITRNLIIAERDLVSSIAKRSAELNKRTFF